MEKKHCNWTGNRTWEGEELVEKEIRQGQAAKVGTFWTILFNFLMISVHSNLSLSGARSISSLFLCLKLLWNLLPNDPSQFCQICSYHQVIGCCLHLTTVHPSSHLIIYLYNLGNYKVLMFLPSTANNKHDLSLIHLLKMDKKMPSMFLLTVF